MTTDISYFSEGKMNAENYRLFGFTLPARLHDLHYIGRRFDNVLQGYRGPAYLCDGSCGDSGHLEASNGIQEVRFWYGCTKKMLLVPVVGWFFFGVGRANEDMDWRSIFFDATTGEALSKDRAEAERMMQAKKEKK
jgi:hypothetical protein